MIAELESHVRECWKQMAPRRPEPRKLHFLKLSLEDYPDPQTALLLLVFPDRARRPVAAIKISRHPASDAGIRLEAEKLQLTHTLLPPELARLAPPLLRCATANERPFLLSTCLPGEVELHHTWGARRARSSDPRIRAALNWSLAATAATPAADISCAEWLDLDDARVLVDMMAVRGWNDASLAALEASTASLLPLRWPSGFAHGDFFPGNVLFEGNSLSGVVDWGMARERAPLFFDLMTYEVSFSLHALSASRVYDHQLARAVHELPAFVEVSERLQELGIETGFGAPARLATLIAGVLSNREVWGQRRETSRRYDQLLQAEIEQALPPKTSRSAPRVQGQQSDS